jgi:hypothetical protein
MANQRGRSRVLLAVTVVAVALSSLLIATPASASSGRGCNTSPTQHGWNLGVCSHNDGTYVYGHTSVNPTQPASMMAIPAGFNSGRLAAPVGCEYRWAGMFTARSATDERGQGACVTKVAERYYGWAGIDGRLTTPSANVPLDPSQDHQLGWLGIGFSNGGWVQIGWFRGVVGCGSSSISYGGTGYHLYIEGASAAAPNQTSCPPNYFVHNYSPLSLGGTVTYLISHSGSCWNVYYNYSFLAHQFCGSAWPSSGAAEMENELLNNSGTASMPTAYFGNSNPNTNEALRIRGAGGWEPWTPKRATELHDTSSASGNDYTYMAPLNDYYYALTWGPF